ncbi:hypothetical protein [Limnobacter sp.]|uniref:hypothetical protein n=1 Tax=Limnobacter sp. TaxID=2003368 RepID=UPI0025875AE8|nr:hypothetical protein [Limnobacter sp.]
MTEKAGRACPIRYRYNPRNIAQAQVTEANCLYVVGGLYGNPFALAKIKAMAAAEGARICFNGDFNWFNVDPTSFQQINEAVLKHDAIAGNVEAELAEPLDAPDCGCAYPDTVDQGTVERSNRIHTRLKTTAQHFPELTSMLVKLPFFRRYRVGEVNVGVVHGDAESLSGWRFDPAELENAANQDWLRSVFEQAEVDVFASSHTCTAGFFCLPNTAGKPLLVSNNGAAGMPSVPHSHCGLFTRIGTRPSRHPSFKSLEIKHGVWVEQLPIDYPQTDWIESFLSNWPEGSAAHTSYFQRIGRGYYTSRTV